MTKRVYTNFPDSTAPNDLEHYPDLVQAQSGFLLFISSFVQIGSVSIECLLSITLNEFDTRLILFSATIQFDEVLYSSVSLLAFNTAQVPRSGLESNRQDRCPQHLSSCSVPFCSAHSAHVSALVLVRSVRRVPRMSQHLSSCFHIHCLLSTCLHILHCVLPNPGSLLRTLFHFSSQFESSH